MATPSPHYSDPIASICIQILLRGFSRVPVYADRKDNVVGMLLVKRLIKLDPSVPTPIHKLEEASMPPPTCLASTPLYDLLNQFQTGKSHLSLVYSDEPDESGQVGKYHICSSDNPPHLSNNLFPHAISLFSTSYWESSLWKT